MNPIDQEADVSQVGQNQQSFQTPILELFWSEGSSVPELSGEGDQEVIEGEDGDGEAVQLVEEEGENQ